MSRIEVLIVDDEPLAREGVRVLLEEEEGMEIVGECGDGEEAVEAIRELRPDLVFLDIQMPELDGFDVLERLDPDEIPVVVFVTAYDEYAIRAFDIHALDYVLKPFDDERFRQALERARSEIARREDSRFTERVREMLTRHQAGTLPEPEEAAPEELAGATGTKDPQRLVVRSSGRIRFVTTDEIEWIEAAGDYVRLHVGDRSHLLRETMKGMEAQLDSEQFVRVHRSTIVRLSEVREIQADDAGQYDVILRDGTRRSLSRSGRERLEAVLGHQL